MTTATEPAPAIIAAPPPGDDAVWAARLAQRDPAALREMIARHGPALHRVAYRMTGDAHEAEDIVQEALLRLWDHASAIAAKHPVGRQAAARLRLGGWLQRVATNLAIDRLRRARRISGGEVTYYEELPNAEAAEALDMNIKAFESLLHRARTALRQALAAQGDAP
jgi:RNA polymerase sigma-70 factor (ECF subfamily)